MTTKRLLLVIAVLVFALFVFIVFGRIAGFLLLILGFAVSFYMKQPLKRLWGILGD